MLVHKLALFGAEHIRRRRLLCDDLPWLRPLEGAKHDEDGLPILLRPDCAGGIGASLPYSIYMIQDGGGSRTQEEVALGTQMREQVRIVGGALTHMERLYT